MTIENFRIKVLVVENNEVILRLLCHHLKQAGCDVQTAQDGIEALSILEHFLPDILFTDIIMPRVGGDQLCKIIRNDVRTSNIFIAVHSSTSLEDNRNILNLDADVYLTKGPSCGMKEHVLHTLAQFTKGERRNQTTVGGSKIYPQEITRELLLERRHTHAIFNHLAEAVVEIDVQGHIVQANYAAERLLQRSSMEILSRPFLSFFDEQQSSDMRHWLQGPHTDQEEHYHTDYKTPLLINGRKIFLQLVAITEKTESFIIGILQDVTLQKQTEEALASTLGNLHAVLDTIDYGVLFVDAQFISILANQAFRDIWEVPAAFIASKPTLHELCSFIGNTVFFNRTREQRENFQQEFIAHIEAGNLYPIELSLTNGKTVTSQCIALNGGGRLFTCYDITNMKNTERNLAKALSKVQEQAYQDPLTGLPNLRLAKEQLASTLARAQQKKQKVALMFLDLDGFKNVNDTFGHDTGDKVLRITAQRLTTGLRESDTVARIGGDEFLIILRNVRSRQNIEYIAEKIIEILAHPMEVKNCTVEVGASIGIAIYPENGTESKKLMKLADDAMYHTKRIGKNSFTFALQKC